VPALHPYRAMWPYLRRVDIATESGGLRLGVVFTMTGGIDA
jgi:hypothetical protein